MLGGVYSGQAQQDRIIQNAAIGIRDQDVFALPNGHSRQIARRQHLHELGRIRPGDLNLTLNGHVTQDCVVYEVPEILLGVTKVTRDIHMIINRKARHAPTNRRFEIGGFADLCAEAKVVCLCHVCRPFCAAV